MFWVTKKSNPNLQFSGRILRNPLHSGIHSVKVCINIAQMKQLCCLLLRELTSNFLEDIFCFHDVNIVDHVEHDNPMPLSSCFGTKISGSGWWFQWFRLMVYYPNNPVTGISNCILRDMLAAITIGWFFLEWSHGRLYHYIQVLFNVSMSMMFGSWCIKVKHTHIYIYMKDDIKET